MVLRQDTQKPLWKMMMAIWDICGIFLTLFLDHGTAEKEDTSAINTS
jgi:hypothetical protein